jgi:ionotropic glutamate receptor
MQTAISTLIDLTWGGWALARDTAAENGIPYVHVELSNRPFVEGIDEFLYQRQAIDAALLFESGTELDQSLYYIIGNYHLRVLVLSAQEKDPYSRMSALRPVPSAFVAFGTTQELTKVIGEARTRKMIRRAARWNFVIEDFEAPNFVVQKDIDVDVIVASLTSDTCCGLLDMTGINCQKDCPAGTKPKRLIATKAGKTIGSTVNNMTPVSYKCAMANPSNASIRSFVASFKNNIGGNSKYFYNAAWTFAFPLRIQYHIVNQTSQYLIGVGSSSDSGKVKFEKEFVDSPIPRFFRVGMAVAIPWLYEARDPKTKDLLVDKNGNQLYEGYCMDLLDKISKKLNFEYEVVVRKNNITMMSNSYGKKDETTGEWDGLIGDLARGETDLVVADLTMTSEREEIIDFVSPYFDQAGISIVLRKKVREQSLFKFLSVLKTEVWLGIVGAVIVTALLIWLLDRYSPYSARNNKAAYPYPCRDFTLKESFWFALTSLTPQGGGEAPKALSGRVLVAAYWLFVVLMLATFTANLAAFLTVERMQTTVQSLEELARQSRINYTVTAGTSYMEYFVNMAGAEEELYNKWKELTLNSSGNPSKYRVWDYPIREQYTHILRVIEETVPVKQVEEGLKRVLANENGEFAFIHDAARIRYEVYNNCNLTEVGEPFAEQPYALAVQQGSHLQEELSRAILELQKDRYFEGLQSKYWNNSAMNDCPVLDDSDGITLQSLGGVFIATLIGLGIALITLGVEVALQKRKEKKVVGAKNGIGGSSESAGSRDVTSATAAGQIKSDATFREDIYGRGGSKKAEGMPSIIGN